MKEPKTETKTRKSEVRFSSLSPKDLIGNYLVKSLRRKWLEDVFDNETQDVVTIERSEIIMEKGVLLNADNIARVMFHIQSGDITEPIEVSNQSRMASETSYYKHPYFCKVEINGETWKLLLEAKGVQQTIDIVKDYLELNSDGRFAIREVKAYDSAVILTDRLKQYPIDEAQRRYMSGEISFEEFMDSNVDENVGEEEEKEKSMKFYSIKANAYMDGEREPDTLPFLVVAADADRAILTINAYLQRKQEDHNERMRRDGRLDDIDQRTITATIEESKIVKFTRIIPDSFCRAYYESED